MHALLKKLSQKMFISLTMIKYKIKWKNTLNMYDVTELYIEKWVEH